MQFNITPAIINQQIPVDLPTPKILEYLGEEGMRKLISDHYDLLRQSNIKGLFPPSNEGFEMAKKHSADFFIQICGGPSYFNESRGAPMMRARHASFRITIEARRIWLESYAMVLNGVDMPDDLKQSFWNYIDIFSMWMINSNEEGV